MGDTEKLWDDLGQVEDLKDDAALGTAMKSDTPTVIFMYMDGCVHCKKMWPIIKNLANKHPETKFKRIESNNIGENAPNGYPHYLVVKNGSVVKSFGGSMEENELESKLSFSASGGRSKRRPNRVRKLRHGSARRSKGLRPKLRSTRKSRR